MAFESRRKGKAVLRPKTRINYKDLETVGGNILSLFLGRKFFVLFLF